MSTDAILASIDGALRDYGTSPDAMRWNPALSEAREEAVPRARGTVVHHIDGNPRNNDPANLRIMVADITFAFSADCSQFAAGMERMMEACRQFGASLARTLPLSPLGIDPLTAFREHGAHTRLARIRCRDCNLYGNPGKLAVNGHEYRRRQLARARRRRR